MVKKDFENSWIGLQNHGILVMDDSSLYLDFDSKYSFSFKGHEGPSRILRDEILGKFDLFLTVGHLNFLRKK